MDSVRRRGLRLRVSIPAFLGAESRAEAYPRACQSEAKGPPVNAEGAARDFPVVCVGGSAGGLDAYTRLLRNLPADMGVAIVIVNHLRTVSTLLHKILPNYTTMP